MTPWLPQNTVTKATQLAGELSPLWRDNIAFCLLGNQKDYKHPPLPEGFHICFCTATFKRSHQITVTLPMILVTLEAYLGVVTWVLVCFEDDAKEHERVISFVHQYGHEAIVNGLACSMCARK